MATLLIVDDDENLRLLYEQEFTEAGYDVVLAANAEAALEYLQKERPDVAILDIAMPGMDGIQLMWSVLARDRLIPVILNTAFSQHKENYMTWPANAYIVKSGDLTELKNKVSELIQVFGSRQPA